MVSVEVNGGLVDPPDLHPPDPQPTSWRVQHSDIHTIVVTFSEPIVVSPGDLVLTNLGLHVDDDEDVVQPLTADQLGVAGETLTIRFSPYQLPDGVYKLEVLGTVTDLAGDVLDGNGDDVGGDSYEIVGDDENLFYKLTADFNGDFPAA